MKHPLADQIQFAVDRMTIERETLLNFIFELCRNTDLDDVNQVMALKIAITAVQDMLIIRRS